MPRWLRITPAELIGFTLIYIAVRIIWLRLDLGSTTAFVVTILAIAIAFRFAWRGTGAMSVLEPRYEDCFALVVFGKRIGPFRETRASAMLDALDMGHATRDEHDGRIWITVPADIATWRWEPVS